MACHGFFPPSVGSAAAGVLSSSGPTKVLAALELCKALAEPHWLLVCGDQVVHIGALYPCFNEQPTLDRLKAEKAAGWRLELRRPNVSGNVAGAGSSGAAAAAGSPGQGADLMQAAITALETVHCLKVGARQAVTYVPFT